MLNKNIRTIVGAAALCILSASPNMVLAQGKPTGQQMANSPLAIYSAAGASQAQLKQIADWVDGFTKMQNDRVKTLYTLIQDMRKFSMEAEPNDSAVLAKQGEINNIDNQIAMDKIKLSLRIRHLLTPQQRAKLVALMKQEGAPRMMPRGVVPSLPRSVAAPHAGMGKGNQSTTKTQ